MAVFAQVKIDEQSFRQAEEDLVRLPLELRNKVLTPALSSAAMPVVETAKQLAPDSKKTGSRDKWSKKVRDARSGTKSHKATIGKSSVRKYGDTLQAIYVGPLHPAGNLINVIGHPHRQVLWGRVTGKTLPPTQYLHTAAASTTAAQQAAFVAKVKTETDKLLAGMAKS